MTSVGFTCRICNEERAEGERLWVNLGDDLESTTICLGCHADGWRPCPGCTGGYLFNSAGRGDGWSCHDSRCNHWIKNKITLVEQLGAYGT